MKNVKLKFKSMGSLILAFLIVGIALSACKKIDASKGEFSWKTYTVSNQFEGIEFALSGSLVYTESTSTSIEVYATEKVHDKLEIMVENNTLKVKLKNGYSIVNGDDIQVNISAPNVHDFYNSGSGDFEGILNVSSNYTNSKVVQSGSGNIYINQINAYNQEITLSGSGNISIDSLNNTSSVSTISGDGIISVTGLTVDSDITISGSGTFSGFNYISDITEVLISGSGNAQVYANSLLNATISGSGSVFYKGTPSVNVSGSGSGTVTDAN